MLGLFSAMGAGLLALLGPDADEPPVAPSDRGDERATAGDLDREHETDEADATPPTGLTVGVVVGSAYVFRGLNLLQNHAQQDSYLVVQPSIAWEIASTGLTLGYFTSHQVSGPTRAARIADGSGEEQDVSLSFERSVGDLTIGSSLAAYAYPFARRDLAGTSVPIYVEPSVCATASMGADLAFAASLMAAVQDAIRDTSYIYLSPSIRRDFALDESVAIDLFASYGAKLQRETDNVHDVLVEVGVRFTPLAHLDIRPSVHWAWTNLSGRDFQAEQAVWGAVGAELEL